MQENAKKSNAFYDWMHKKYNAYLDYIESCKLARQNDASSIGQQFYLHHIVPRHHYKKNKLDTATFNIAENTILLTFQEHITAHSLRYTVYQEYGDKAAVDKMSSLKEEGFRSMQQAGGQAVNVILKAEERCMHSRDFQLEMARRSMANSNAREVRSQGGKKGARVRHTNRTVRVEDRFEWSYKKTPLFCTFGFDYAGDLVNELHKVQQTKLTRITGLVKGDRKTTYGWSCKKIA
jgi:hypothetical protein